MNLLARFEKAAKVILTFLFRKAERGVQPVEIAKALTQEMLKNKQVSISHVYIPNVYRVYVSKQDFAVIDSFGETMLIELARYLYDEGTKQGYTFLTLPLVTIEAREGLSRGGLALETDYQDDAQPVWREGVWETGAEDLGKTAILPKNELLKELSGLEQSRKIQYYIEVILGEETGKKYYLRGGEVVLGREGNCQMVLKDSEISRRHLKLSAERDRWVLEDLGSTNGTSVNGLQVDRYMLRPGDKISAGQTEFIFREEK